MEKYRVIAKEDLHKGPHTWHKGLDYELVDMSSRIILASDQGQINLLPEEKEKLSTMFDGIRN